MNELNKLLLSILLIAAGFMGASLLGPPDLGNQAGNSWNSQGWGGPSIDTSQGLQPLSPEMMAARTQTSRPPVAVPRTFEPPRGDAATPLLASQSSEPMLYQTAKHDPNLMLTKSVEAQQLNGGQTPAAPAWGSWPESPRASVASQSLPTSRPRSNVQVPNSAWGIPAEVSGSPGRGFAQPAPNQQPAGPMLFAAEEQVVRPVPGPAPVEPRRLAVEQQEISHVVTDGDTLATLASRYLGDSQRANELFDLNRDRLENPDLLPIGMMIRVPVEERQPEVRQRPTQQVNDPWATTNNASAWPNQPFQKASISTSTQSFQNRESEPNNGFVRESRLAPVDMPIEKAPAPRPQGEFFNDWSW